MKVLVVDDEKRTLEGIVNVIQMYCPEVKEVFTANGVQTAVAKLNEARPDLVLLDIQLKDGTGFDVVKYLQPLGIPVIFITAYEEFAIKAFNVAALHYMLKPIDPYELSAVMKRAFLQVQKNLIDQRLSMLLDQNAQRQQEVSRIVLKTSDAIHVVEVEHIVYCEADKNYTTFFLQDGRKILVSKNMGEYETLLPTADFLRIHQSFLLNMKYISRFDKSDGGHVVTATGAQLPVSTRKRDVLMTYLNNIR
jgi:two-component system, LytTR family, response regulator